VYKGDTIGGIVMKRGGARMVGYSDHKDDVLLRLRRIEG
jgi:hypothetical protein